MSLKGWGLLCLLIPIAAIAQVPTLQSLKAQPISVATMRNWPSVTNTQGQLQTSENLTAIRNCNFPPLALGGTVGTLLVDGAPFTATKSQWFPYQVVRQCFSPQGKLVATCTVRLAAHRQLILWRVQLEKGAFAGNHTLQIITANGAANLPGPWAWDRPLPPSLPSGRFVESGNQTLDSQTGAASLWSFPAPLPPSIGSAGGRFSFALAIGKSPKEIGKPLTQAEFNKAWNDAYRAWNERWKSAFQPHNQRYSGHLPVLISSDAAVKRTYYESCLCFLTQERTNFPQNNRVFVTCGPEWATTLTYFWDASLSSKLWAMLAPRSMKKTLLQWLGMDFDHCYAEDQLTGKGEGPWYAANDYSIFKCLWNYESITGDKACLAEKVKGLTVLQWLNRLATQWRGRVQTGRSLADYGEAYNLLECVPTYTHEVPSLNAANYWMMKHCAALDREQGNTADADKLNSLSTSLLPQILKLYKAPDGVWTTIDAAGKPVPMRHVYDFVTIGTCLAPELTLTQKEQMTAFVKRELLYHHWMRAQSLLDPAAKDSDRPDHGPKGSYDAWPAKTIEVFALFEDEADALKLMRNAALVTDEGPFSQSHEFINGLVRIAHRGGQDYNAICGAAFAESAFDDAIAHANRTVFGEPGHFAGLTVRPQ